jgi:thiol-disulfide isomerase/thioredoxin
MTSRALFRVTLGALLAASLATPASAAEAFRPFKLKALEGGERKLADVLGKATLVVFFFPTCSRCNAAFPDIQKLYDTYAGKGLSMVWINVIPEEERLIADWRTRRGFRVPILLGGQSIQDDYKLAMTPTHYLLDSQGRVLARHAGYTTGDEKTLERQIQQALGLVERP